MQTEVKKAWLRRSLTQDIKQKSRMTSSAGGGSCYYGGVMSHTTAHSVSLSVVTPRSLSGGAAGGSGGSAGGGSGLRPPRRNSVCPQSNLPACTAAEPETARWQQEPTLQMESGGFNRHVRASLGSPFSKSSEAAPARRLGREEPDGIFSLKELETVLWLHSTEMCFHKYCGWHLQRQMWDYMRLFQRFARSNENLRMKFPLKVNSVFAEECLNFS